ncbi:MAG: glycosyltransferase family 4 protein [Proteobacteria bacterium]|nr:glycosyltransferase family 4 protein [Pseudomonadota bacterium]
MNDSPRKILLVSRCAWTLYNFRAGLMRSLKGQGWQVVAAGAGGDGYEDRIRDLGIPFHALPLDMRGMNPLTDLRYLASLVALFRRERPDVVHHFTIKPVIYGGVAARLAGVPRVVNTITGLGYAFTGDRGWLTRLVGAMYRVSLAGDSHTWFLNPEDLACFTDRKIVALERAGILPGEGVDCGHFSPRPRPEGEGAAPLVLYLGRMLGDKGLRELAEAAGMVRQARSDVRFRLVGPRDVNNPSVIPAQDLERWVGDGLVEWPGATDDVRPHLAGADVVVLPSYREGVPRSLLEAGAMERPVVATDVAGCREVVEHGITGLLVPPRDAGALARAVESLLADPVRARQMGRAARERVLARFSEDRIIETVKASYGFPGRG